jgi:uncharacterized protein with NAD-binding domain and iron-sulfur cluster
VGGSGTAGRRDLPAEHGFRFFPGFYRHLPDTMKRIPGPRPGHHVFDELVAADRMMLARENGADELITAAHAPASLDDFAAVTKFMFTVCTGLGISPEDQAFFVDRLLVLLTSCDERRFGQWERQSWWQFVDAEHRSPGFRRFLADGLTRMLVAAQAQEISARTGGYILLQLIFDLSRAATPTACSTGRPARCGSIPGSRTCAAPASTCGPTPSSTASTACTDGSPG